MDKYDIVLDLIEHPAKYTPERIPEILSDPEAREIYNLLCKTDSTLAATDAEVDVNAEWQKFSQRHKKLLHIIMLLLKSFKLFTKLDSQSKAF